MADLSTLHPIFIRAAAAAASAAPPGSASTSGTAGGAPTRRKKPVEWVRKATGFWHWYIVAAIIAVLAVVYALRLYRNYAQRKRSIADRKAGKTTSAPGGFSRTWSATSVLTSNFLYVRSFPLALYSGTNVSEIFFSVAYLGVCLGLTMYKTYQFGRYNIELPFGMMAYVQLPLIIGLASRNNTISYLTGISYQNLNYLHRAAGRVCYLFSWIHTISYCVKGLGHHGPGDYVFWTGVVALGAFTIVVVSSFALARRIMYETFLILHIIFVLLFLVGCYMHRPKMATSAYIIAGFVIWGFDRLVSLLRMAVINKVWLMPFRKSNKQCSECTIELVNADLVRVTVPRPLLRWGPGQHALITMPTVARLRYEQHPFSFANVPSSVGNNAAVFIIRAHDGFTRRLIEHLDGDKTTRIPCYLDGPYGMAHSYTHHDSVLLISGGTGITHVLSIFLSIIEAHRSGQSAVRSLRLVWNVRHLADVNLITPLLNEALSTPVEDLNIRIAIHLTRSRASDEPDMVRGLTEALAHYPHDSHLHHNSDLTDPQTPGEPSSPVLLNEKAGQSTNVSSSSTSSNDHSANASQEKLDVVNEKKGLEMNTLPKIQSTVANLIVFKAGRAALVQIMEEEVAKASTTMGVSVCGPAALSLDTRKAVREVNTAKRVMGGQAKMELSVEKFGW